MTTETTTTFTTEQFERLLEAIRPGGLQPSSVLPNDDDMCRNFALELLQTATRNNWWGDTSEKTKWTTLKNEILKIAREYI